MTLQEILKAQGLSDEQITKVIGDMKQNKIFTAGEENLDVRYGKLKTDHDALTAKQAESEKLISELQKVSKNNESIQTKIAEYESMIARQTEELQKTKIESALKVALLGAKAIDVDYLAYKVKEKGELELDEKGEIKGIDNLLTELKTQIPSQFESSSKGKNVEEHRLGENGEVHNHEATITKEEFNRMGYQGRLKLKQEQPEVYAQMTGKVTE